MLPVPGPTPVVTSCLKDQANVSGMVRDVGIICPLTRCGSGVDQGGCYTGHLQTGRHSVLAILPMGTPLDLCQGVRSSRFRVYIPRALWRLELAKLHTALAQVAAIALNSDGREWVKAAGPNSALPVQPRTCRQCLTARNPECRLPDLFCLLPDTYQDRAAW